MKRGKKETEGRQIISFLFRNKNEIKQQIPPSFIRRTKNLNFLITVEIIHRKKRPLFASYKPKTSTHLVPTRCVGTHVGRAASTFLSTFLKWLIINNCYPHDSALFLSCERGAWERARFLRGRSSTKKEFRPQGRHKIMTSILADCERAKLKCYACRLFLTQLKKGKNRATVCQ